MSFISACTEGVPKFNRIDQTAPVGQIPAIPGQFQVTMGGGVAKSSNNAIVLQGRIVSRSGAVTSDSGNNVQLNHVAK